MVLVLFFCSLVIIITVIIEILLFSVLRIKIENNDYKIILYIFGKIPVWKIQFNKYTLREKIKKYNANSGIKIDKTLIKNLKLLSPKIEKLDLELAIKTEDAVFTSFLTASINSLISIFLPFLVEKKNIKNIRYEAKPIFRR